MKSAIGDAIKLIALLAVVILAAFIPYHVNNSHISHNARILRLEQKALMSAQKALVAQHKNEVYACRLNGIFRKFVSTATDTRLLLAQQFSRSRVKRININAAKAYKRIRKRILALPPTNCKKLLGG